ncbi:MAG TPA: M14 family zinc carboxypeptidase [Frankiaceae bacterium]|nr:M14 family zinc carboxypeptidase [Frankiaceae bacterium]
MPALLLALGLVSAGLASPTVAHATPVQCAADDPSPDGRVFPEPILSVSFVRFSEFQCSIEYLESKFPDLIDVTTVGESLGGHPIYDVLVTDETVKTPKRKLLVVNSIHGNEPGGREGGMRVIEDWVDPRFDAGADWVQQGLDQFVVHFLFPNPDGWAAGDVENGGYEATRGNDNGRDLNRQFPVKGYIYEPNKTLAEPESQNVLKELLTDKGWYLGTDNHGQGPDTYGAAGLQIVGQFDFQKSETLARYADAISDAFAENDVLSSLEALNDGTGQDLGAYHWGTLYDMLGYSASGSLIDYYNTYDGLDGTGYATELTVGNEVNMAVWGGALAQLWVDLIRAINDTMLKQALIQQRYTFPIGGDAAYVHDPAVVTDADANGSGYDPDENETAPQKPYRATRMRFFEDLNRYASKPLAKLRAPDIASGAVDLTKYDSLVLADKAFPEGVDEEAFAAALKAWVAKGGNLVVTDAAAPMLVRMGLVANGDDVVREDKRYVGYVDFTDRALDLNAGLRGVARQTYDSVPIGFAFPPAGENCPNWTVDQAAWEDAGGTTAGTNGTGRTIWGEAPMGEGRVRFLGALLPQPTEDFYHPYGLQNYAVTYTGYTLLQNALAYDSPSLGGGAGRPPVAPPPPGEPPAGPRPPAKPRPPLATTGGLPYGALAVLAVSVALLARRRRTA